jgi:hypothetical protein
MAGTNPAMTTLGVDEAANKRLPSLIPVFRGVA